jgi:hypothetical protein
VSAPQPKRRLHRPGRRCQKLRVKGTLLARSIETAIVGRGPGFLKAPALDFGAFEGLSACSLPCRMLHRKMKGRVVRAFSPA